MESQCCEALQTIIEKYDLPFYRPLMVNRKTLDMTVSPLAIKLLTLTASGNISKKGSTVIMYYCPICGTKLYDDIEYKARFKGDEEE